jgi:NAD(P)-dependent dehydrogenase (short-subunit alcohol dehydrogenase family)
MTESFDGNVALVTGAGSGIGRASALAFAREGARVVVSDVDVDGGEQTVHLINDLGGDATFIRADVAQSADVKALIAGTIEAYGRLDYPHNNAGISGLSRTNVSPASPLDYPEEQFDRVIAVNLKGVWLCMQQEIPPMLAQGGGAIVNTASIMGLVSTPGAGAYAASKHGVIGLTKSFALAYAAQGIRVNAICPGYIDTPMVRAPMTLVPDLEQQVVGRHPVGRLGTADEIAAAVIWLCSDAASFVTGHAMVADGGYIAQ